MERFKNGHTVKCLKSLESFPLDLDPETTVSRHSDPEICLLPMKQNNCNV